MVARAKRMVIRANIMLFRYINEIKEKLKEWLLVLKSCCFSILMRSKKKERKVHGLVKITSRVRGGESTNV